MVRVETHLLVLILASDHDLESAQGIILKSGEYLLALNTSVRQCLKGYIRRVSGSINNIWYMIWYKGSVRGIIRIYFHGHAANKQVNHWSY